MFRSLIPLALALLFCADARAQITFSPTQPFTFDNAVTASGFPGASYKELRLTNSGDSANVLTLRNLHNNGLSALTARDLNNNEKLAVGWGNPAAGMFANCNYIQTWTGELIGGTIPEFFISGDGDLGIGDGFRFYKRFRIHSNGDVSIPRRISFGLPQEDAFHCEANTGAVTISTKLAGDALTVHNRDAAGYATAAFRDNNGLNRLFVGHGNPSSIIPNTSYLMTSVGNGAPPQDLAFCTFNSGVNVHLRMTGTGNIVVGDAPLATTATDGFFRIPSCAGVPTGAADDGSMVRDSVNHKVYIRSGGNWIPLN